jgi:hypothetical protein
MRHWAYPRGESGTKDMLKFELMDGILCSGTGVQDERSSTGIAAFGVRARRIRGPPWTFVQVPYILSTPPGCFTIVHA